MNRNFVCCLMLSLFFAGVLTLMNPPSATTAEPAKKPVLRHVVLYKFKPEAKPEHVQEVIDTFAALPAKIDTIVGFEHGLNVSQEGKSDGLTHCFVVSFRDEKGLAHYLQHPAHQDYVKVVRDRREKVVVVDYWSAE